MGSIETEAQRDGLFAFSNNRKTAPKGVVVVVVGAIKTGLAELEPSLNPHHFIPIYPSDYLRACIGSLAGRGRGRDCGRPDKGR